MIFFRVAVFDIALKKITFINRTVKLLTTTNMHLKQLAKYILINGKDLLKVIIYYYMQKAIVNYQLPFNMHILVLAL